MANDTDVTAVLEFRHLIKETLPQLYDEYWEICDSGHYWDFPIVASGLRRFKPLNALLRSGTRSVRWAYDEFIETAAMARAAENFAQRQIDESVRNFWRFHFRNRTAADALRHFFRFLDHTTHHLFEISDRKLIPGVAPKSATFSVLRQSLKQGRASGSRRVRLAAHSLVELAARSLTPEGWRLLQVFRNVDTHRYVVGIDHISYGFSRNDGQLRVRAGGRLMTIGDPDGNGKSYSWYGLPDIDFATVNKVLAITMANSKAVMKGLSQKRLLLDDVDS
jgi:hypothetical protein